MRSPPLTLGAPAFTCLELAGLGAWRGGHPPPCLPPTSTGLGPQGAVRDGISSDNRESKPISPDSPPTADGLQPHAWPSPTAFWLCSKSGENSCPLAFGKPTRPAPPAMEPPGPVGTPVPQALLDTPCTVHPVPTWSPYPVSSILLLYS